MRDLDELLGFIGAAIIGALIINKVVNATRVKGFDPRPYRVERVQVPRAFYFD